MLTFTDEKPPPIAGHRWGQALQELKNNPGVWAILEGESPRVLDHLKVQWEDLPIIVTMRKIHKNEKGKRVGTLWLKWEDDADVR